jgi:hypothetical protein
MSFRRRADFLVRFSRDNGMARIRIGIRETRGINSAACTNAADFQRALVAFEGVVGRDRLLTDDTGRLTGRRPRPLRGLTEAQAPPLGNASRQSPPA